MPNSNEQFIQKLSKIIEANLGDEHFRVSELAEKLGMSRVMLYRKIKLATNKSASKFINEYRLEKGKTLLEKHTYNVSEVAYKVGFGSPSYFIKCFHDHFGYSPREILNNNNTENLSLAEPGEASKNKLWRKLKLRLAIILFVISAAFIFFSLYQNIKKNKLEKTIAVLEFVDKSPDESLPILYGLRENILTNLELIDDVKLVARATSNQYNGLVKSPKEIGKKLNANYLLKGELITINGTTLIYFYLIEATTGKTLFPRPYQREITIENFHEIQNEIAQLIAEKLNAHFTPEEQKKVAKKQTKNMAALNFYLQGINYQKNYELSRNAEEYLRAKKLYKKAIELDSTFADAYCQLAEIYISSVDWNSDEHQNINSYNLSLDSGFVKLNKAIKFNGGPTNKTLQLTAIYYKLKGMNDKALTYFEQLWKNRKDHNYYLLKSDYYYYNQNYYGFIENTLQYLRLKPKSELINLEKIDNLVWILCHTGFPNIAEKYATDLYKQQNDSLEYLVLKAYISYWSGDYSSASKAWIKIFSIDSLNVHNVEMVYISYFYSHDFKSALKYAIIFDEVQQRLKGKKEPQAKKGYVYLVNGMKQEAELNFTGKMEDCLKQLEFNLPIAQRGVTYGTMSGLYSMQGDIENGLKYLKLMVENCRSIPCYLVYAVKESPYWENLHDEPEYNKILEDLEAKYQNQHNRVEQLLIREGIIHQ